MVLPANALTQEHRSRYMRVYGVAQPPYAFVEFCDRMPLECRAGLLEDARIAGTPQQMAELDRVNRMVNHDITPVTDMELYGVPDYWTIPTSRGDYILDNKNDELRLWYQTPYEFLMRQSYIDPHIWMSLDPHEHATSVPVAGPRLRR